MSLVDVTIGRLPDDLEQQVLEGLGFDLDLLDEGAPPPAWARYRGPAEQLSLLDLASLRRFNDHAARLEGFADAACALGRMRFGSLPLWEISVWLPVPLDVSPPDPRPSDPVFIGSATTLLEELAELQRISELGLGAAPDGYAEMRADLDAFYRSPRWVSDEADVIRWVWRALRDGAEAAVSRGAPLLCVAV